MNLQSSASIELAVFHLNDVCVRVQEGLDDFLATAAIEKVAGIEAVFRWLGKRSISVALLSDFGVVPTQLLLDRLGWRVGEEEMMQAVVCDQPERVNPLVDAMRAVGVHHANRVITLFDTPRLLELGHGQGVYLNIATTDGAHPYQVIANCPASAILDNVVQLPTFLVETLLSQQELNRRASRSTTGGAKDTTQRPWLWLRQWLPLPAIQAKTATHELPQEVFYQGEEGRPR